LVHLALSLSLFFVSDLEKKEQQNKTRKKKKKELFFV